jgi:di- and tripeptidase
VDHTADWWLGDLTHPWFLELERAISDEWGVEPMRVREGGVRTSLPFASAFLLPLNPSLPD